MRSEKIWNIIIAVLIVSLCGLAVGMLAAAILSIFGQPKGAGVSDSRAPVLVTDQKA